MAIMASNGAVEAGVLVDVDVGSSLREGVEEERRSPAPMVEDVVDWIWDAE